MTDEPSISYRQRQSPRVLAAMVSLAAGLFGSAQAGTAAVAPGPAASSLRGTDASGLAVTRNRHAQVSLVCPGYAAQLQDQLAYAALRSSRSGSVRVEFSLRDGVVDGLQMHGGPLELRTPIRRAMAQLKCQAIGEPQRYAIVLGINSDLAQDAASPVALLSEDPHAQSAVAPMDAALR